MLKELRSRQNFTKPSVENRQMRLKAAYIEQLKRSEM